MTLPVDLHGQANFRTVEVEDVRSNRVLPAELEAAKLTVLHAEPEAELLWCHGSAQTLGALEGDVAG